MPAKKQVIKKETKKDKPVKKDTKKTVKTVKSNKKIQKQPIIKKENSKRHFSIVYNGKRLSSTPSGKRPKQAANKALTAIFNLMDEKTRKDYIDNGKEVYFDLYENGRKKKNAKGLRRIFRYTGMRVNTCDYCFICDFNDFCDDCKKKIKTLQNDIKKEQNSEKIVMKNLKLYKRYLYCKEKGWKLPELNEHIEKNKKVYDGIINCKKCKKDNIEINHMVIKYSDECLKLIDELHNSNDNITKKQVIKNIQLLKDYMNSDISKRPELNSHIKDANNLPKYEKIVKSIMGFTEYCKEHEKDDPKGEKYEGCKLIRSPIGYKYTNIVRKSTEEDLKHIGKLITSEEIDKMEEEHKEEINKKNGVEKKEEPKKEVKKAPKKKEDKKEEPKKVQRKTPAKKQ